MNDPENTTSSKNILLCFDGTGNQFGKVNTNVVKLFKAVQRNEKQAVFYDPGVGTWIDPSLWTIVTKFRRLRSLAFGKGISANLADAYRYLMQTYNRGDRVFIFGFSRGAFTAQAMAGLLYHFGVLERGLVDMVNYVLKHYHDNNLELAPSFKSTFCHQCDTYFLGLWDCVASLGRVTARAFFDASLNPDVRVARHAVSLDERRKKFPVSLWQDENIQPDQNVEQVWFPCVHADVGGGYEKAELSNITLNWMLDEAQAHGVLLRGDRLESGLSTGDPKGKMHQSYTGFWRLWRGAPRSLPEGSSIHCSVLKRMGTDPDYTPQTSYQIHAGWSARDLSFLLWQQSSAGLCGRLYV